MFYSSYYNSPVGRLLLASDGANLTGLWIEKQKYYADTAPDDIREKDDLPRSVSVLYGPHASGHEPDGGHGCDAASPVRQAARHEVLSGHDLGGISGDQRP